MKKLFSSVILLSITLLSFAQSPILKNDKKRIDCRKINWINSQSGTETARLNGGDEIIYTLDSALHEVFDTNTSQWTKDYRDHYIYDDNGLISINKYYNLDEQAGNFGYSFVDSIKRDDQNKITGQISYYKDVQGLEWIPDDKEENIYNDDGLLVQFIDYDYNEDNKEWIPSSKNDITYNENDKIDYFIFSFWDQQNKQWSLTEKEEYQYENGVRSNTLILRYDGNNQAWINREKEELTYTNGKITQSIYFNWDENASDWVFYEKGEYEYDNNGNPTGEIYYEYVNDEFSTTRKFEYSYDLNKGNIALPLYYFLYPDQYESIVNMPLSHTGYDYNPNIKDWEISNRGTYYSSEINLVSSTTANVESKVIIYPNPANDFIIFNLENTKGYLEIHDMKGKILLNKHITNNQRIDVSAFPNGIYLYKIDSKEKEQQGKFTIAK